MSKAHGEGGIDGTSWCRSTKMQTMRRRIDIVEDIIDTSLQAEEPFLTHRELVIGRKTPDLIPFAVAVNLIIALARHTAIETCTQMIGL